MSEFYYRVDGQEFGPVSLELLQRDIAFGQLVHSDEIRRVNDTSWISVAELDTLRLMDRHQTTTFDHSHRDGEAGGDPNQTSTTMRETPLFESHAVAGLSPIPDQTRETIDDSLAKFTPVMSAEATLSADTPLLASNVDERNITPREPDCASTHSSWYARTGQVERGPMDFQKLLGLATAGYILPTDRVRHQGESDWKTARTITGLFPEKPSPERTQSRVPTTPQSCFAPSTAAGLVDQAVLPAPFASPLSASAWPTRTPLASSSALGAPTATQTAQTLISHDEHSAESGELTSSLYSKPDQIHLSSGSLANADDAETLSNPLPTRAQDGESKHKLRRGKFEEPQLYTRRNITIASCIGAVVLLYYFVWAPPRVTVLDFVPPCQQLESSYLILITKWSEKPTEEFWAVTRREVFYRLNANVERVRKLHLNHDVRNDLILAGEAMMIAVRSDARDEVTQRLEEARKYLSLARKEIDEVIQHGETRKKPSKPTREKDPNRLSEETYL